MKYYRVPEKMDNKTRYSYDSKKLGRLKTDGIFVGNELYTEKEAQKYFGALVWLDPVEIPKNNTYFFFGARFEISKSQESI